MKFTLPQGLRRTVSIAALVLYSLALAAGSLVPVQRDSALAGGAARRVFNNLLHVPAYGVLALLWVAVLRQSGRWWTFGRACFVGVGVAVAFGGAMEGGQRFFSGRTASVMDFLLNAIGALAAAALLWAWRRRPAVRAAGGVP